jgi:hypothetical protein
MSKYAQIELRDGTLASDKMHKLVPGVPAIFSQCPPGYTPPGDSQVEVIVVEETQIAEKPVEAQEQKEQPEQREEETHKRGRKRGGR